MPKVCQVKEIYNMIMTQQFIRFVIAGGGCFLFELAVLYILTEYCGLHYLISAGIAFTLSVIVNYILCVKWVFHAAKQKSIYATAIFFGSSVFGLAINQFAMWLLVDVIGLYYMMAKIVATGIVTIWNYVMKRYALKR